MVFNLESFSNNYIQILMVLLLGYSIGFTFFKTKFKDFDNLDKLFVSGGLGVITFMFLLLLNDIFFEIDANTGILYCTIISLVISGVLIIYTLVRKEKEKNEIQTTH